KGGGVSGTTYELAYNGSTEISGASASSFNDADQIRLGKATDLNGNNMTQYYAGIIFETGGFTADAEDALIKCSLPIANGSTMQWTAGTNSSDYQEVDELPPDDDTTYVQGTATGDVALFDLQSSSTLGIGASDSILAVMPYVVVGRVNSGADFTLRTRSGSTNSDNANQGNIGTGWTS